MSGGNSEILIAVGCVNRSVYSLPPAENSPRLGVTGSHSQNTTARVRSPKYHTRSHNSPTGVTKAAKAAPPLFLHTVCVSPKPEVVTSLDCMAPGSTQTLTLHSYRSNLSPEYVATSPCPLGTESLLLPRSPTFPPPLLAQEEVC